MRYFSVLEHDVGNIRAAWIMLTIVYAICMIAIAFFGGDQ